MQKKIGALASFCFLLPTFVFAAAGPKISLSALEHDFGDVIHGQSPSVDLIVTNTGDQDLILERVISSCGCAKAIRGSRRVVPGSSSTIHAQIETFGMLPGRHSKTVTVYCNDRDHPETRVQLKFTVVRHVSIQPQVVATVLEESDREAVFLLKAINHWTEPLTLKAAASGASEDAVLTPQEVVVPPGGDVEFHLSIPVQGESGQPYLKGKVLIETNDTLEKELQVRYFVRLPRKGGGNTNSLSNK